MLGEWRPVNKPKHNRRVPKRGNLTKISTKARKEVIRRSEGRCERCGRSQAYAFEVSHLVNASQLGSGSDPANLALLCGPKVNKGTCHNFADETAKGREWKQQFRKKLQAYYQSRGE
jgi:hypothetical protein